MAEAQATAAAEATSNTSATAEATPQAAQTSATASNSAATAQEATKATTEAAKPKEGEKAQDAAAQAATQAKDAEAAKVAAAANAEKDEIAAALANLNREVRAARAAKENHEKELARVGDKVAAAERLEKARAALKSKDYISALTELDPEANVDEAILTLIDQAKAKDAQPLSQEQIQALARKEFEAQQKAAQEKKEAADKAIMERSTDMYMDACDREFSSDKFPLIAQWGLSREEVEKYTLDKFKSERVIPSPEDTLKHFESRHEAKVTAAGYTKAQIAAMKEGATPAEAVAANPTKAQTPTAPVSDTRGAVSEPSKTEKRETMKEYDARIKAQLRAMRGQGGATASR